MNRLDEKIADRRRAKLARAQPAPPPDAPEPRGEKHAPWPKGTSGNPSGYSQGRRNDDLLLHTIEAQNHAGAIGEILRERVPSLALAQIMIMRCLAGDFRFFKLMLQYCEDPPGTLFEDETTPEDPETTIDPEVIARMKAVLEEVAAAAEGAPPAASQPPAKAPSTVRAAARPPAPAPTRPPDVSRAEWLRAHPGWTEAGSAGRNGTN